jgi:hypothetical protein
MFCRIAIERESANIPGGPPLESLSVQVEGRIFPEYVGGRDLDPEDLREVIAAERTARRCYGTEIDPPLCRHGRPALAEADGRHRPAW